MKQGNSEDIIKKLTGSLQAVRPLASPGQRMLFYAVPATICLWTVMILVQAFRASYLYDLQESSVFSLEVILGYATALIAIVASFVLSVPGAWEAKPSKFLSIISAALLLAVFTYTLYTPSLELSMLGKREVCFYETVVYGLLLAGGLFFAHRRSLFFHTNTAALLIGFGSGLLPAVTMQMACMYDPSHALLRHYAPVLIVTGLSLIASRFVLQRA